MYVHMYIYMYIYIYIYIYVFIYCCIQRGESRGVAHLGGRSLRLADSGCREEASVMCVYYICTYIDTYIDRYIHR